MKKYILVLSLLAGCASPPKHYVLPDPVKASRVGENKFILSYDGDPGETMPEATQELRRRAASLTVKNGYSFFAIENIRDTSGTRTTAMAYRNMGFSKQVVIPQLEAEMTMFKTEPGHGAMNAQVVLQDLREKGEVP